MHPQSFKDLFGFWQLNKSEIEERLQKLTAELDRAKGFQRLYESRERIISLQKLKIKCLLKRVSDAKDEEAHQRSLKLWAAEEVLSLSPDQDSEREVESEPESVPQPQPKPVPKALS